MKPKVVTTILAGAALALMTACPAPTNDSNATTNRTNGNAAATNSSNAVSGSNVTATANTNAMSGSNTMGNSTNSNPMVGGAPMYSSRDIIDNAVNSKEHTTLVAAVKAAGLVDTLKGAGPFTVFAPTDAAFKKLPAGTVDGLLKPDSKEALTKVLTYHVVPGRQDATTITKAITDGGGKAVFNTVQGGALTASMEGETVILTDEKGGKSKVTIADVMQSNGVIHVVDKVLMPN